VHTQVDDNTPNQATDPPPDEIRDVSRPTLLLPDRPAIAVLPFTNMSGDPEQEYFSDGISEDIITALSKLRWFFVIARNSSFVYKGKAVHMKQVAEELGVGYVVEGSVRKSGDRVRITAQLNDVSPAATSGRSVTTAILPTFSRFRTRSPNPSLQRLSRSCTLPKIFAPDASRPAVSMPGIW
jgi:TolB-like protein